MMISNTIMIMIAIIISNTIAIMIEVAMMMSMIQLYLSLHRINMTSALFN